MRNSKATVVLMLALSPAVVGQTLTESTGIVLVRDGALVSEHLSWEACQVESHRLAVADPRTSGSVTYSCQTETRRLIATYTPPPVVAVPAIYVNHDDPACSNAAPGTDPARPLCDLQTPTNLALVTGKTTSAIPDVQVAASATPYRLFGNVDETTVGTTWQGMGATPGDVMIVPSQSAVAFGITATAARTNVCQFDPGTLAVSLFEVSRETDIHRFYPPSTNDTVNNPENGVLPYYQHHARGDQPNLVNTSGTTVTATQGRGFVSGYVGKTIEVAGTSTTVATFVSTSVITVVADLGTQTGVGSLIRAAATDQITNSWLRDTVSVSSVSGVTLNLGGTGSVTGGTNPWLYPAGRTIRDPAGNDFIIDAYPAFNQLTLSTTGFGSGVAACTDGNASTACNATIEVFDTPCPVRTGSCGPPTTADLLDVIEKGEMSWGQDMETLLVYFHPSENRACSAIDALEVSTTRIATTMIFHDDNTTLRNMAIWGQSGGNSPDGLLLGGEPLRMGGNGSLFEDLWTFGNAASPDMTNVPTGSAANLTIQDNLFASGVTGAVSVSGGKFVSGYVFQRNLVVGREGSAFTFSGPGGLDTNNRSIVARNIFRDTISYKRRNLNSGMWDWYQNRSFCPEGNPCINGTLPTHVLGYGGSDSMRNILSYGNVTTAISDAWVISDCIADCVFLNNVSRGGFDISGPGGANAVGSIEMHNNVGDSQDEPTGLLGASTGPLKCRHVLCAELVASSHNVWFTPRLAMLASRIAGFSGSYALAQLQAVGLETGSQAFVWNAPEHLGAFSDRSIRTGADQGGDDYRPKDAASVLATGGNPAQCAWITTTTCSVGAYLWQAHSTTGPWNADIVHSWLLHDTVFAGPGVQGR
jgi:hypothetical protein